MASMGLRRCSNVCLTTSQIPGESVFDLFFSSRRVLFLPVVVGLMSIGMIAFTGCGGDSDNVHPQTSPSNEALLDAASPFEDLTEYAEAGDRAGMSLAITSIEKQCAGITDILGGAARQSLDSLLGDIKDAQDRNDQERTALDAVSAYRLLVDALDTTGLLVPKDIELLDYSGFRVHVLTNAGEPDWPALQSAAEEATSFYRHIKPLLGDPAIRDAIRTAVDGMNDAVKARDIGTVRFSSEMVLALVDVMEEYFQTSRGNVVKGGDERD